MTHPTVIKLHDGNLMPQLGLGVWKAGNEEVVSAIHKALEVGYRSFDTAAVYQNETGVGNALSCAGVPRDELFVTTKLWNDDQKQPKEALQESLKKLKLDYVDLYLIHWPTESWSPLAQGGEGVFDQKIIRQLADKYGKTPAQIVIRWHLDSGLVVIPKSVTPSRIAENFNVWDFRLDKDELSEITKLDQNKRLGPDPDQFGG